MQNIQNSQYVTQAQAANIRNVKRQRIGQLIKKGKLQLINGKLSLEEVLSYDNSSRGGRPRLDPKEVERRMSNHPAVRMGLKVGHEITWKLEPKNGYGYSVEVPGTILKIGRRIRLNIIAADGDVNTISTKPEFLSLENTKNKKMYRPVTDVNLNAPVFWLYKPKDSFGYYITIPATVLEVDNKITLLFRNPKTEEMVKTKVDISELYISC